MRHTEIRVHGAQPGAGHFFCAAIPRLPLTLPSPQVIGTIPLTLPSPQGGEGEEAA